MRKVEYLSPTSIKQWRTDKQEFYRKYLADWRPPYEAQSAPMVIGVVFDAYVKSQLVKDLVGSLAPARLELAALLDKGISKTTTTTEREIGLAFGKQAFQSYVNLGCYANLLQELERSGTAPMFEFTVDEMVKFENKDFKVKGKPDLAFSDNAGLVILDWKCNGLAGSSKTSPKPSMWRIAGALTGREKVLGSLALANPPKVETVDEDWGMQLCLYGESLGSSRFRIEQLCGPINELRIASYVMGIGQEWRAALLRECCEIWEIIQSGWIFRNMSEDESRELQARFDSYGGADDWTRQLTT